MKKIIVSCLIFCLTFCFGLAFRYAFLVTEQIAGLESYPDKFEVQQFPAGDVRLKITKLSRHTVRLTVTNVSNRTVYLPYLGHEDGSVFYSIWGLERLDYEKADFEPYEGGDFSPGLHPLEPGKSYHDERYYEKGVYRAGMNYMIDPEEVERRSRLHELEGEERRAEFDRIDRLGDSVWGAVPNAVFAIE